MSVEFPLDGSRRSTSATGRAIVAAALAPVDPIGAASVHRETNWRSGYLRHFRRLVEAGLPSPAAAGAIAAAGLAAVHERMRWTASGEVAVREATRQPVRDPLGTESVALAGEPERELSVPYHGGRLRGDDLLRRLDAWVEDGIMEPSAGVALAEVIAHPEWLAVPGRTVVAAGAAAEMGPLRALLRWGATVAAVDLPSPALWRRLLADVDGHAGTLLLPARTGDGPLEERTGIDLVADLPAATQWVESLAGPLVLGNYVYADGGTNVLVSTALDVLTEHLLAVRGAGEVSLAFLATPTDVFAVPREAVEASTAAYTERSLTKLLRVPLRTLTGGRLLRRNYLPDEDPGLNDSVVLQQGPNYLLAKRIQRWRATSARAAGVPTSFTVAPPTRTRSVVKNRALAAAYAGAHRFGIEVFEPGTSNTLMAALLVHDLATGRPPAGHPWQDEAYAAVHGGLWRTAYDPRSALGLAALLGAAAAR